MRRSISYRILIIYTIIINAVAFLFMSIAIYLGVIEKEYTFFLLLIPLIAFSLLTASIFNHYRQCINKIEFGDTYCYITNNAKKTLKLEKKYFYKAIDFFSYQILYYNDEIKKKKYYYKKFFSLFKMDYTDSLDIELLKENLLYAKFIGFDNY